MRLKVLKEILSWVDCGTSKKRILINYLRFGDSLNKFRGKHTGYRAFVVGNGPSLNSIDMSLLKNEITFGSNRVYLGFKVWGFHFKYWASIDTRCIVQLYREYNSKLPDEVIKFVPVQYAHYFNMANMYPINVIYRYDNFPQFSCNPDKVYEGWTVTYVLLQIAIIMGCNPIYLVGVDYSYKITDKEKKMNGNVWTDPASKSHFMSGYCASDKGIVWNIPKFDKTDKAFEYAAKLSKEKGIEIYNATPGSKLKFFPFVKFENIFK